MTSAPAPEGPWDPPAVIEENGIDPSLFTDGDGKRYMVLNRGARLTELMKQPQYSPLTNAEIVIIIYAGTKGYLDAIPVKDVTKWEHGLIQYLRNQKADLLDDMTRNDRKIAGELEDAIKAALDGYAKTYA